MVQTGQIDSLCSLSLSLSPASIGLDLRVGTFFRAGKGGSPNRCAPFLLASMLLYYLLKHANVCSACKRKGIELETKGGHVSRRPNLVECWTLIHIVQGTSKRLFPGCVKSGEKVAFCLPTSGRQTQFFHHILSQPGKSHLEIPCR